MDYLLRNFRLEDAHSLARSGNNRQIWLNLTDRFPHPYTELDAISFIENIATGNAFAIDIEGEAVGCIGLLPQDGIFCNTAELGYWLGEPYWGQGIMTAVVKEVVERGFNTLAITKIAATVFHYNLASMRVLEKLGFEKEAIIKRAAIKDGKEIDIHHYALFK